MKQVQKGVEKPGGQLKVSKMDRAGPKRGWEARRVVKSVKNG